MLETVGTVLLDAVIAVVGVFVVKWLNAWAKKNSVEAANSQFWTLRDTARIAVEQVEQWTRNYVKEHGEKPSSVDKLAKAVNWVCQRYSIPAKDSEQVEGLVEAAVFAMNKPLIP